jgi:isopentenyl-diphosphate delta-isomerase
MNNEEQIVLVDSQGQTLLDEGQIVGMPKLEVHQKGIRHLAISVFIFNSRGRLLLQQRALTKYHSPGKWSNTCCTHPRIQETPSQAAHRRLSQEMGITTALEEGFTFSYWAEVGDGLVENEFDHIFIGHHETEPVPDPEEVHSWRWISPGELQKDLAENESKYAIWFQILWPQVKRHLKLQ